MKVTYHSWSVQVEYTAKGGRQIGLSATGTWNNWRGGLGLRNSPRSIRFTKLVALSHEDPEAQEVLRLLINGHTDCQIVERFIRARLA